MNAKQIAVIPVSRGEFMDVVTITLVNPEKFGLDEKTLKSVLAPAVQTMDNIEQVLDMVKKLSRAKSALDSLWWTDDCVCFSNEMNMNTLEWAIGVGRKDFNAYVFNEQDELCTEYEVETVEGELVNCFTWSELRKFFKGVAPSTLKSAMYRGSVLLGQYKLAKVMYALRD